MPLAVSLYDVIGLRLQVRPLSIPKSHEEPLHGHRTLFREKPGPIRGILSHEHDNIARPLFGRLNSHLNPLQLLSDPVE
jgi:hypothetical protein